MIHALALRLALLVMRREPDRIIGKRYMHRWYVIPRNPLCNIYVHRYHGSDDDRAEHDHPWWSASLLLRGWLLEVIGGVGKMVRAGDWRVRPAQMHHRLVVPKSNVEPPLTLFITGPRFREWGFYCPQGWRHWKAFTDHTGNGIGRGCD